MEYKYDIALSFAGEDGEYVERVATLLKEKGIRRTIPSSLQFKERFFRLNGKIQRTRCYSDSLCN